MLFLISVNMVFFSTFSVLQPASVQQHDIIIKEIKEGRIIGSLDFLSILGYLLSDTFL